MSADNLGGLGFPWAVLVAILIAMALTQFSFFVTTIYLHRALAHRSVTLSPATTTACRILIWVGTGTRPRQWVAVHRKHHAHTDEEGDPHSPFLFGYAAVQFNNVGLYRKVARDPAVIARYARDLPPDRWDHWLFDRALVGLAIGILMLCFAIGWELGLITAGVYTAGYLLGGGAINGVGHWWGKRPYDNLGTNNQWLAWMVAGEGLHNNHHAATTSARFSLAPGEVDPGWWIVRLLMTLRLATVRHAQIAVKAARR
ncbi:MAG: fatty acid desaturase [Acidimicrobiales bacterium]